jgi:hypothetical protein
VYQNSFLDENIGRIVLLKCWMGPTSESSPTYERIPEGTVAVAEPHTVAGLFVLESYDEVGLKGYFADAQRTEDDGSSLFTWGAVISLQEVLGQ